MRACYNDLNENSTYASRIDTYLRTGQDMVELEWDIGKREDLLEAFELFIECSQVMVVYGYSVMHNLRRRRRRRKSFLLSDLI